MIPDIQPGQKFGSLTAVAPAGVINGYKAYTFKCVCGVEKIFAGSLVRNGRQRSCGCARLAQKASFKSRRLNMIKARKLVTEEGENG